jgi:nucleoside-diphosphate-sugar epimerase
VSRTLLIAGHGYLGRELGHQAGRAGWNTVPLTRTGEDRSVACDLSDPEQVLALRSRSDLPPEQLAIVHCASSGRGGPDAYRAVFTEGCRHLLETFPEAPLLFVSSTSVYGQTDGSLVTEESPAEPERETSRILLETESLVLRAGGIIARLAGLYGPGRSVILRRFLDGTATIEEDGRRFLNQIHRDDAASAILHLLSRGPDLWGEVFNVADSSPLHQAECYHALAKLYEVPAPPTRPRNLERKRAWTHKQVSNTKLLATGWDPQFPSFLDAVSDIAPTL